MLPCQNKLCAELRAPKVRVACFEVWRLETSKNTQKSQKHPKWGKIYSRYFYPCIPDFILKSISPRKDDVTIARALSKQVLECEDDVRPTAKVMDFRISSIPSIRTCSIEKLRAKFRLNRYAGSKGARVDLQGHLYCVLQLDVVWYYSPKICCFF